MSVGTGSIKRAATVNTKDTLKKKEIEAPKETAKTPSKKAADKKPDKSSVAVEPKSYSIGQELPIYLL